MNRSSNQFRKIAIHGRNVFGNLYGLVLPSCSYCGKPTSFLQKWHPACQERYQQFMASAPNLLSKAIDSPVTGVRFAELLQTAAKAYFVPPSELKSLSQFAINNIIDTALQAGIPNIVVVNRWAEITYALESVFGNFEIDEHLAKIAILSELGEGKTPDQVTVGGPLPIEFGHGEIILWVFNGVQAYLKTVPIAAAHPPSLSHSVECRYLTPRMVKESQFPNYQLSHEVRGDLVLTNRNIHLVLSKSSRMRISIPRVTTLHAYADGIHIEYDGGKERSRTFFLDDPWFMGNVLLRLLEKPHRAS